MKRTVIGIALIVASLAIGIGTLFIINSECNKLLVPLEELKENAKAENASEVVRLSKESNDMWEQKKTLFHILVDHNEMTDIEISMQKLMYYSSGNDFDSVLIYTEDCAENIRHVKESCEPSLSNVF